MHTLTRFSLAGAAMLLLFACRGSPTVTAVPPVLHLIIQTQNGASTFQHAGEVLSYQYAVTNTGSARLAGPVVVVDGSRQVACPPVNTVGNLDSYLDLNETITCAGIYTVTQADVNAGSITSLATARAGGAISNQAELTLTLAGSSGALTLSKTANPSTYGQAGQTITYTYVITNTGSSPLGPTQFTISDNKLGAPFNCGPSESTLTSQQTLTCSAAYVITQADMNLAALTNTATASGGGQTSIPVSLTITNSSVSATPTIAVATPGGAASPTLSGATPNPTAGSAIRITISPGQTTTAVNGVSNPNETVSYVLNAVQGQVLGIALTTPADTLTMGVSGPSGAVLKAPDTTPTWSTAIPEAGDYLINIKSTGGNSSMAYTLVVSLTTTSTPASATSQP